MTRTPLTIALAAALLATVALAGCKKKEDETAATPPPAATTAAPMPTETAPPPPATVPAPATSAQPGATAMTVTSVDLGSAVGTDNRVAAPMTEFAKTDTIHASVATDGGSAGTLNTKWTFQDGQVVHTEDKSVAAGPQITEFSISKPDGWPAGKYKLDVSLDGKLVQSRDFTVK